jgi:hypothetical protein
MSDPIKHDLEVVEISMSQVCFLYYFYCLNKP